MENTDNIEQEKMQQCEDQGQQEKVQESQEQEQTSKKEKKKKCFKHDDSAQKIQELGEKLAELNDKYIRTYSEYENYRKRTQSEKAELILNGGKDVLKSILPIVDDLERALQAMTDENAKEGVTMIYNKLMNTLSQKGVRPIEAKGAKFDDSLHEAVTQFPAADESQKNTVIDVVEKGYFINDKVLRYAKVVVAI
ncbi:MAG: nucleotide exchange factor GrpE [Bacteroidales bacterium]|nr:nucleotide exchange factor GrpE [Candidatus Colimorpha pelethequi]